MLCRSRWFGDVSRCRDANRHAHETAGSSTQPELRRSDDQRGMARERALPGPGVDSRGAVAHADRGAHRAARTSGDAPPCCGSATARVDARKGLTTPAASRSARRGPRRQDRSARCDRSARVRPRRARATGRHAPGDRRSGPHPRAGGRRTAASPTTRRRGHDLDDDRGRREPRAARHLAVDPAVRDVQHPSQTSSKRSSPDRRRRSRTSSSPAVEGSRTSIRIDRGQRGDRAQRHLG